MSETGSVERWGVFEWSATSRPPEDPAEVPLRATFRCGPHTSTVDGFHDGDGLWRVRFMPDVVGDWQFWVASPHPELDGQSGTFTCVEPGPGNHGPVRLRGTFHFQYADGTPYLPFGTTCYAWIHQPRELQRETLRTLGGGPFNKLRMCVFPKHYIYNENEPELHAFVRRADGRLDFDRLEPEFFRRLEARIEELGELGIEADVILFHPYDRWGYADMTAEQDERYVRHMIARFGACRNVWWSVANEFDLMSKAPERWDSLFRTIAEADASRHLTSIHNADRVYDQSRSEITHVSLQSWDVKRTREWRESFQKPIVNDEPEYEGNIPLPWGNISARELVHRFWVTATSGGYAGHGETYLDDNDILWWSKGGRLRGDSPARIAFLRRILEEASGPLEPLDPSWVWRRMTAATAPGLWLIYFGEHQPRSWTIDLPSDPGEYAIDIIDPWEMEVVPVAERAVPPLTAELPGRPYLALRVRRV